MPSPERQLDRAARAVSERIKELGLTVPAVARSAGIHPNTLRRFVRAENWPARGTITRLNAALLWPDGEIGRRAVEQPTQGLDGYSTEALILEVCRRINGHHGR